MLVKFVIKEMLNEREKRASLPAGTAGADAGGGSGGVGRVPAVVSQWESGKTFPSVKKQIVLSRLYGVPMEQLYPEGAAQAAVMFLSLCPSALAADAPNEKCVTFYGLSALEEGESMQYSLTQDGEEVQVGIKRVPAYTRAAGQT